LRAVSKDMKPIVAFLLLFFLKEILLASLALTALILTIKLAQLAIGLAKMHKVMAL